MKIAYCLIAAIFLGASIMTTLKCATCGPYKDYLNSLTPEQKKTYQEVVDERKQIYFKGLILGFLLAWLYYYNVSSINNVAIHTCAIVTIAMGTQYLVYQLHPKKQWMLNSLETREQIDGWLNVYKYMKAKYHWGMILGLIGFVLLAYGSLVQERKQIIRIPLLMPGIPNMPGMPSMPDISGIQDVPSLAELFSMTSLDLENTGPDNLLYQ
jgi:hypothetical protein